MMVTKFPWASCKKLCKSNQHSIFCVICETWLHLKCTLLSHNDFVSLGTSNEPYYCLNCCSTIFPFHALSNDDTVALHCDAKIIPNLSSSDADLSTGTHTSQYCPVNTFSCMYENSNDFVFLHVNVRSLLKNFEKLEELLQQLKKLPDVIAISETKLNDSLPNLSLPGYNFVHVNSKTTSDRVGLFIKCDYTYAVVTSLSLNSEECEDLWIELLLPNNEKCTLGVIHRHPR